jgi:hypothetical protein
LGGDFVRSADAVPEKFPYASSMTLILECMEAKSMVFKSVARWLAIGSLLIVAAACTPETETEVETPQGETEIESEPTETEIEGPEGETEVETSPSS